MATFQVLAAQQFLDTFDRADIKLQCLVRGALQDMANRFRSVPSKAWAQYQQWEGFGTAAERNELDRIIEVPITGGVRMLAGLSGSSIHLLDLGPHDIERQWDHMQNKPKWVKDRLANIIFANNLLIKGSENPFISLSECEGWSKYFPNEDTSEWVTFLDTKQYEVVMRVTDEIEDHLLGDRKRDSLWLILGGPGTGKTVVLLKLLQKLLCAQLNVGFSCSDAVSGYLESATRCIIPRWDPESTDDGLFYDVLLYDDPWSLEQLMERPHRKTGQPPRALVYAFDPLQLFQMPTNDELSDVINRTKAKVYELSICYRQRERLAKMVTNMTEVLAKSSPFLRQDKMADFTSNYSDLLTRFNNPEFHYPLGEYKRYPHGSVDILKRRIDELCKKTGLWTHSPPFLLILDKQLDSQLKSFVNSKRRDKRIRIAWSDEVDDIKGVDFQHVVIVLSEDTWTALQEPFQGSGRPKFNNRRLMRIPFSRARDSLSLVIWDTI